MGKVFQLSDCFSGPSRGSHGPTPQASQGPFGWHLFPLVNQLHHSVGVIQRPAEDALHFTTYTTDEDIHSIGLTANPWGIPLITGFYIHIELLAVTLHTTNQPISLSISQSIHQIHNSQIYMSERCGGPFQRPYGSPDRRHQLLFPYPLRHFLHCRGPLDYSGVIWPCWSHICWL